MGFIEIIIIGIMVNFAALFCMLLINLLYILVLNKFDVDIMKNILYLEHLNNKVLELKRECKSKNISTLTQESFIIYIPFSGIFLILFTLYHVFKGDLSQYLSHKIEYYIEIFENKLKNAK